LCALDHKLFDLGALGLSLGLRVMVSAKFSARTPAGRAIYDLHGHELAPRPATTLPAPACVTSHTRQVFKGEPLAA
jgi:putative restriction endonuclease